MTMDTNKVHKLSKFDARKLMEVSIEVMKLSIPEDRGDKVPPAVGAVIWFPEQKEYLVAYRGELRDGDHGEFTLLERKLANQKLDDCVLFTTLEPCMERNEPKVPCARRVTNARIKTVYVGISDPDVTVDGKGIAHLENKGVEVVMYDRDLQEQIEEINKKFIENANERKKAEESDDSTPLLEASAANVDFGNLSTEALSEFLSTAKLEDAIESEAFKKRLTRLNLLDADSEPTNNGIILFGSEPRETIVDSGVLGTIRFEDGSEETKDFDGPQVLAPQQIMDWIKSKVPNPNDRSDAKRKERDEAFFELVREGVVNAIVHRDYTVSGSKIQVNVTKDSVTIMSPGSPLVTLDQLRSLNAPMRSRNPTLHYVFNRMELAEERGLGLKSMRQTAEANELPRPTFSYDEPYLILTIYRSADAVSDSLSAEIREQLNDSELAGFEWLVKQDWVRSREYADALKLERRAAGLHLKKFVDVGIATREGSGRSTRYHANG